MDLYIVLGVRHGASEAEIRRAYKRLARQFHPDVNPGDRAAESRFRQIVEAYETLVDPDRRVRYDAGAQSEPDGAVRAGGFDGFDFSARGVDHSATFGDLLAEVLGERGQAPRKPERGADLHEQVALSFEESLRGASRPVVVTRRVACGTCEGSGLARASVEACQTCQGSGLVRSARGHMVFSRRCQSCGGTGRRRPSACGSCAGAGYLTRVETVQVKIPAGIADGERVRVAGRGHAGRQGGPSGDLLIGVRVASDPRFSWHGADLCTVVPVAVHEAALGARIEVPTPDGPTRLRVPPGTQSGHRFRLKERGAPSPRGGPRGDLLVEVRMVLPPVLDERSKELLREFGRLNDASVREGWRG